MGFAVCNSHSAKFLSPVVQFSFPWCLVLLFTHLFWQGVPAMGPNVCDEICLVCKNLACLELHSYCHGLPWNYANNCRICLLWPHTACWYFEILSFGVSFLEICWSGYSLVSLTHFIWYPLILNFMKLNRTFSWLLTYEIGFWVH